MKLDPKELAVLSQAMSGTIQRLLAHIATVEAEHAGHIALYEECVKQKNQLIRELEGSQ